jgi:hypothetical protein
MLVHQRKKDCPQEKEEAPPMIFPGQLWNRTEIGPRKENVKMTSKDRNVLLSIFFSKGQKQKNKECFSCDHNIAIQLRGRFCLVRQ